MGNRFTIIVFRAAATSEGGGYEPSVLWTGNSLYKVVWKAVIARRNHGLVQVEIR